MRDYNRNMLDMFRIIATVQVFLGHIVTHFHMPQWLIAPVYILRGVPILFFLCGFLAAKSMEKYDARSWLYGRAVRILPGFWACIAINSLIILAVYSVKPTLVQAGVYAVTQFFGLNFYTGDWLRGYGVGTPNGVLWTIPVQIQFFLLVPVIHRLLSRRSLGFSLGAVGVLAAGSLVCRWLEPSLPGMVTKLIGVTVVPYLYFLVGGMAVWYHRDRIVPFLEKYRYAFLAAFGIWTLLVGKLDVLAVTEGVMYNVVSVLLTGCVIFAFAFRYRFRLRRDLTYGFYLYHMVFVNLAVHFALVGETMLRKILVTAVIAVFTWVCAWLSQRLIEEPAAKRLLKKG